MIGRAARLASAAGAVFVLAACAGSPKPVVTMPRDGYLSAGVLDEMAAASPPPPAAGSAQDLSDKATSARYVALEDGDRWLLATSHAEVRPPLALQHFDCALGVRLGSAETPVLDRMMGRIFHDAASVAEQVKARQMRPRPVADDPRRRACQTLDAAGRGSGSYPSGSAAVGVAYGEAFAALEPDRAEAVRRIGHEIGVSRLVCAMHYPSDVAAGETIGRQVAVRAVADPAFQTDMAAAEAELAAARRTGLTNPGCAAERATLATVLP
ncbi:Major phosphate-irrepressible acid phosphatase precursor [Brevundimonas sp. SH203]|uniref:phosphatase PAP2 family protein n=1 Tax=Brevundimonas sp. SH203 TaxID=345167 RepID=UPI0009CED7AD|nr:phosphatase PAP2 family protein [Brevundimonas sp. SH203]GAW42012.1 Major phosphate-irrepressible acid phosphatase precursor [Brevundimonas sp. SH203]